jgi:TonB family protein
VRYMVLRHAAGGSIFRRMHRYVLVFFVASFSLTTCCFSQALNGPAIAGVGGVGSPACVYCPKPGLPKGVRNLQNNVVVVLRGVIQTNGRAANIAVVKSGDASFDEKAVETVRRWRFKPASGPNGKPVSAITAIEVTWN